MTAIELVNEVFDRYYHNNYLPSKIGGSPETKIVRFFMAITNPIAVEQKKADITKIWIDEVVTWYTRELPQLLLLPKFPGETDQQFLQRMFDFAVAQELGGQSSATIIAAVYSLISEAVANIDAISIISSSSFNEWKDKLDTPDAYWTQGYLWADTSETLRASIRIKIQFAYSGVSTDPANYEYWEMSQNYTKIQDVVNLFKLGGITFELELISP